MQHILPYELFERDNGTFAPLRDLVSYCQGKSTLFITTSNRWDDEVPKSTELAMTLQELMDPKPVLVDATKIKIYPCEGNVSHRDGNHCGVEKAIMKDEEKNPGNFMRCWASLNNKEDELWKISKEIYTADVVVFFGSIRWGSMNAFYQKLLERLTWIENQHSSLGKLNPVAGKSAGLVVLGHNWRGQDVLAQQKEILGMFGFDTPSELFFNHQWTEDMKDETLDGYMKDAKDFDQEVSKLKLRS